MKFKRIVTPTTQSVAEPQLMIEQEVQLDASTKLIDEAKSQIDRNVGKPRADKVATTEFKPGDKVMADAGMGRTRFGTVQRIGPTKVVVKHHDGESAMYHPKHVQHDTDDAWDKQLDKQKIKNYANIREEATIIASLLGERELTAAEKKKREEVAQAIEREHPGMEMGKKMAIATATAKKVTEQADQLDELSKDTLKSYAKKADQSASEHSKASTAAWEKGDVETSNKHFSKMSKRAAGSGMADYKASLKAEELELAEEIKNPHRKGTMKHEMWARQREEDLKSFAKDPHGKMKAGDTVTGPSGHSKVVEEGITSLVHGVLAKRASKRADDAFDRGDEQDFARHVDNAEYHRVKAGGKPYKINTNPDAKFLTKEDVSLEEGISDADKEAMKAKVALAKPELKRLKDITRQISGQRGAKNVERGFRSAIKRDYKKMDEELELDEAVGDVESSAQKGDRKLKFMGPRIDGKRVYLDVHPEGIRARHATGENVPLHTIAVDGSTFKQTSPKEKLFTNGFRQKPNSISDARIEGTNDEVLKQVKKHFGDEWEHHAGNKSQDIVKEVKPVKESVDMCRVCGQTPCNCTL